MGKGKRLKNRRKAVKEDFAEEFAKRLTDKFQQELVQSELWDVVVAEFGEKRAFEILKECKAEVRYEGSIGESRDSSEDLP